MFISTDFAVHNCGQRNFSLHWVVVNADITTLQSAENKQPECSTTDELPI